MHHEAYMNLVRLFEIPHIDNNKILRALIYSKDDKPPLIDGISKEKVSTFPFSNKPSTQNIMTISTRLYTSSSF